MITYTIVLHDNRVTSKIVIQSEARLSMAKLVSAVQAMVPNVGIKRIRMKKESLCVPCV